jgi:putative DNA primase/helicase
MVSAALAGPLAHLVGAEGGGVHVFGPSSIGKSAMLQAAASVWGRGGTPGYVRSWRATANGLEGAAASATDTCLVLDELGVGEARDVAASVYTLANGIGKARAARDGSAREPRCWRVFVLSSGESPVETKLGEDRGRKIRAGQLVRLLDIPADRALGFGAFDNAGDYDDAGKLADAIKHAAGAAYGTAGPEFIRNLVAANAEKIAIAKKAMATFICNVVERGASEQIVRAAKRFALIAFAGELATYLGVTPWGKGEAWHAAILAFNHWVEKRGGTGSHEERQAIEQVRLIIEQHGEARFERIEGLTSGVQSGVRDRLGWRKGERADREWFVPPEVWKAEFCNGLDPVFVARTLAARGMLRRQDAKHIQCVVTLGEKQRIRAYVLTAAILDSGEGEG